MSDQRTDRIEALFLEAVELAPEEREDLLLRVSRDDPAVAAEVGSLLEFDRPDDDRLRSPIVRAETEHGLAHAAMPTHIGRYRILRTIAAGGMGTVYEAEQDHPQRTVALKLMRRGVTSRSALQRFEHESQILARLHHPGIAQVYDVGVLDNGSGGVPYFVMEYVREAHTLTDFARSAELGTRERLKLLVDVCDAVHHGHQKGVIHRDLKPGNILVDDSGRPKVIDFGVARATDSDIAITTMGTDVGQLLGTLAYMSPEQCAADADDLDTRSDVYSLGLVLYELLCGQLPYDLNHVPFAEAARVIREEAPAKPSTVNRTLRGDVETIALKALEKDRERRYQSATDLGQDIDRYLRGDAIEARPPSAVYRVRTFARRHKVAAAVLVMLLAAVPVLSVATVIAATSAESARESQRDAEAAQGEAESAQREAEAVTELVTDALIASNPFDKGGRKDLLVAEAMEQAIEELDAGALEGQPATEAALRETISLVFEGNWRSEQAIEQAERALEITRTLHPGDHKQVAESLNFLAHRLDFGNRPEECLATWRARLEMEQRLFPGDHRRVAGAMHNVSFALSRAGRVQEAIPVSEASLAMKRRLIPERDHPFVATSMTNLTYQLYVAGREDDGLRVGEEALEMLRRLHGGADDDWLATCLSTVGACLYFLGRPEEALEKHQAAAEMWDRLYGKDHQWGDWSRGNVAWCLDALGRSEEALLGFQARLERLEGLLPGSADSPPLAGSHGDLARCLLGLDRREEALPHAREAIEIHRRRMKVATRTTAEYLTTEASCLAALGRSEEALPGYEKAMEINRRVLPPGHPDALRTQVGTARTLVTLGLYADAEPLLLDAAEHCERSEAARYWHDRAVVEETVRLYEAWHAAEPDGGYDLEAAEWRAMTTEMAESGR